MQGVEIEEYDAVRKRRARQRLSLHRIGVAQQRKQHLRDQCGLAQSGTTDNRRGFARAKLLQQSFLLFPAAEETVVGETEVGGNGGWGT